MEEIIIELAKTNGYSLNKTRVLTNEIFRSISEEIKSGNFKTISIMNLGKFKPKIKRIKNEQISKESKTDN